MQDCSLYVDYGEFTALGYDLLAVRHGLLHGRVAPAMSGTRVTVVLGLFRRRVIPCSIWSEPDLQV
jgi:hypothetical protein